MVKKQQQELSHVLHRAAFVQFMAMVIVAKQVKQTGMSLVCGWYEAGIKLL